MSLVSLLIINFNFGSSISAEDEIPKPRQINPVIVTNSIQIYTSDELFIKVIN